MTPRKVTGCKFKQIKTFYSHSFQLANYPTISTIPNPDGTVSIIQVDPNNPVITLPDGTTAHVSKKSQKEITFLIVDSVSGPISSRRRLSTHLGRARHLRHDSPGDPDQ